MTAEQLLETVAALVKKGMSSDDVVDSLLKMRGGSDDPKAEGAMDRARKSSVHTAAIASRFPNANRLSR